MRPLTTVEADDLPALTMENDLLRHEITHLRARLSAAQDGQRRANQEVRRLQGIVRTGGGKAPGQGSLTAPGTRDKSRNDMIWLLRRLDTSPARVLLRRYPGFRALKERYLEAGQ